MSTENFIKESIDAAQKIAFAGMQGGYEIGYSDGMRRAAAMPDRAQNTVGTRTMNFTFRPAVRQDTPLILGIAGPTKSGKTMSSHRIAVGLANGGVVAMLNAEGARGHQYADKFKYVACDITPPYSPQRYTEAIEAAKQLNPAVLIIDSASHMHDGPGGLLEYHDAELDRMAGTEDWKKRERMTWAAWIRPKKDENAFIYAMLGIKCPVILCFRAKEKLRIVAGKPPIDLGWQPIASDRVSFETIFTVVLPPHCKGVPDLSISEMREPFDAMIPEGKPLDEQLGKRLAQWATGAKQLSSAASAKAPASSPASPGDAQAGAGAGDQTAAAQMGHGTVSPEGNASTSAPAAAPTDAELIADIEKRVKRRDFDSAFDLARGIQDQAIRLKTAERINKALEFVTAKAAAK